MKSKSLYNSSTRNADYGSPFNAKVKSILRFDKLHLMKLLEISQYSFVGFLLGYVLSKYINDYLLIEYDISNYINEDYPKGHVNRNPKLLLHVGWDLLINVISIYYIRRMIILVPYMFSFIDKRYVIGKDDDGYMGFIIGLGLILSKRLTNLRQKINLLV